MTRKISYFNCYPEQTDENSFFRKFCNLSKFPMDLAYFQYALHNYLRPYFKMFEINSYYQLCEEKVANLPEDGSYTTSFFKLSKSGENVKLFAVHTANKDLGCPYLDISLGCYDPKIVPNKYNNYFRFPEYLSKILVEKGIVTLQDLLDFINVIEDTCQNSNPFERKYLGSLIARCDLEGTDRGCRYKLARLFQDRLGIGLCFPGQLFNNTDALKKEFNDDKIEFNKMFCYSVLSFIEK